jgi:hypothetical protein
MYRAIAIVICVLLLPASVAAQQPCTTNARQVVRELYRHMLERQPDAAAAGWVRQLENGQMTVRDVVLAIASSPEYTQRFIYEAGGRMPYRESVANMYRHILGRQPDPEGLRDNTRLAQQSGPEAVVDRLVRSREYSQRFGAWGVPGSGGVRYCPPNRRSQNSGGGEQLFHVLGRGPAEAGHYVATYRNNDGIEADEGLDAVTTFKRPDLKNDDRLSRDQYDSRVIDRGISTLPMPGPTVVVDAWERWMDTGIDVYARDLLLFQATGTIRVGDDGDRDVATPDGAPRGNESLDVPMLTQRGGALIGRIGHSPPFFVGSSGVVVAPTVGRLYLGVNDDDYRDNTGSFEVTITIQ